MGGVTRFAPDSEYGIPCMTATARGDYVLHSDYAAILALLSRVHLSAYLLDLPHREFGGITDKTMREIDALFAEERYTLTEAGKAALGGDK